MQSSHSIHTWNGLLSDVKKHALAYCKDENLVNLALVSRDDFAFSVAALSDRLRVKLESFLMQHQLLQVKEKDALTKAHRLLAHLSFDNVLALSQSPQKTDRQRLADLWRELPIFYTLAEWLEEEFVTCSDMIGFEEWSQSPIVQLIHHSWFWQVVMYKYWLNKGIELKEGEREKIFITADNVNLARRFISLLQFSFRGCKEEVEFLDSVQKLGCENLVNDHNERRRLLFSVRTSVARREVKEELAAIVEKYVSSLQEGEEKVIKQRLSKQVNARYYLLDKRAVLKYYEELFKLNLEKTKLLDKVIGSTKRYVAELIPLISLLNHQRMTPVLQYYLLVVKIPLPFLRHIAHMPGNVLDQLMSTTSKRNAVSNHEISFFSFLYRVVRYYDDNTSGKNPPGSIPLPKGLTLKYLMNFITQHTLDRDFLAFIALRWEDTVKVTKPFFSELAQYIQGRRNCSRQQIRESGTVEEEGVPPPAKRARTGLFLTQAVTPPLASAVRPPSAFLPLPVPPPPDAYLQVEQDAIITLEALEHISSSSPFPV